METNLKKNLDLSIVFFPGAQWFFLIVYQVYNWLALVTITFFLIKWFIDNYVMLDHAKRGNKPK